jgi:energy-coupling factor transporter ATP-binding protein EcfA2
MVDTRSEIAMTIDRSAKFIQAAQNLELTPLLDSAQIDAFRIDYGKQTIKGLKNKLRLDINPKVIFTGHTGSGKSTLLARFAQEMTDDGKFVAFFSIANMVEMSQVNHINVLYSIALTLMIRAEEELVPISPRIQKDIKEWFLTTKTKTYSDGLKGEVSIGFDFFKTLSGKLHKENSFREEIKITYEASVSDLVNKIELIAGVIQANTEKEVLVIIDDLDKLSIKDARSMYHDNLNSLISPKIPIVFTIPIAVVRDREISGSLRILAEPQLLSVPKFYSQATAHQANAQPVLENVRILQDLIKKRIDSDLIEEKTMYKMVLLSGGLLRELVRISRQCCEECLLLLEDNSDDTLKIDDEILAKAIKTLRNSFARALGTNDFQILRDVYDKFMPPDTMEPAFLNLLHTLCVLEYENDDLWYDLHPIIVDLLQRKKVIPPTI